MNTERTRISNTLSDSAYRVRFMSCVIVAQILVLLVIHFWPSTDVEWTERPMIFPDAPVLVLEDIAEVTRHSRGIPPPPKPRIPSFTPSDKILEQEIDIPDISFSDSPITGIGVRGNLPDGSGEGVYDNPAKPATVIKIVEPVFPKEAQEAKIKVTISVTFLVNEKGEVDDVSVNEMRQFLPGGQFIVTQKIGYDLVGITLNAASKWRFRPARHNGKPVKSYVKHEFSFGN